MWKTQSSLDRIGGRHAGPPAPAQACHLQGPCPPVTAPGGSSDDGWKCRGQLAEWMSALMRESYCSGSLSRVHYHSGSIFIGAGRGGEEASPENLSSDFSWSPVDVVCPRLKAGVSRQGVQAHPPTLTPMRRVFWRSRNHFRILTPNLKQQHRCNRM